MTLFFIARFISNYFEGGLGFKLKYESTKTSPWSYNFGACGGNFTNSNGILTSPSYPDNYPDDAECVYAISQPTDSAIKLTFRSMDIEEYYGDCYDYLEIRDGPSADSPLVDKRCGNEIPPPIQSSHNQMWIK